jgi:hypothetical protein
MADSPRNQPDDIDEAALTAAHLAVENVLIEFRDRRISILGGANGFVVNEYDGMPSSVMRLETRAGLRIGIRAYLAAVGNSHHVTEATDDPA